MGWGGGGGGGGGVSAACLLHNTQRFFISLANLPILVFHLICQWQVCRCYRCDHADFFISLAYIIYNHTSQSWHSTLFSSDI